MMKKVIFTLLFIYNIYNPIHGQMLVDNPASTAYLFIKSISTRDSVLFDYVTDKEELQSSLQFRYGKVDSIVYQDLHFQFFFAFSPWKYPRGRNHKTKSKLFHKESKFSLRFENENKGKLLVYVSWENRKEHKLYLRLVGKEWKVVDFEYPVDEFNEDSKKLIRCFSPR